MMVALEQQTGYISKTLEFTLHWSYHEPDTERFPGNQPLVTESRPSRRSRANWRVKGLSQLNDLSSHHNSSEIFSFPASPYCPQLSEIWLNGRNYMWLVPVRKARKKANLFKSRKFRKMEGSIIQNIG